MASVKKAWIKKYGEEEGLKRWKELNRGKGTLKWYINKHGEVDGPIKYKEKNAKLGISERALRANGKTEEEILEIKSLHSKKSAQTLENMIKRYGKEEGEVRYRQYREKNRLTSNRRLDYWIDKCNGDVELAEKSLSNWQKRDLNWFVNKYGEEGKAKYIECQRRKGRTKSQLVDKWGELKASEILESRRITHDKMVSKYGKSKADEILKSKITKFHGSSKIQKKFAMELFKELDSSKVTSFYGDPYTNSYMLNLTKKERLILDQKIIVPDILINNKYIIEFDGTYWHSFTKEKDKLKDVIYSNRGYTVIRVPESKYKKDKLTVLTDIKKRIEDEN